MLEAKYKAGDMIEFDKSIKKHRLGLILDIILDIIPYAQSRYLPTYYYHVLLGTSIVTYSEGYKLH